MATANSVGKALTASGAIKPVTIEQLVKEAARNLADTLPKHLSPTRLVGIALNQLTKNPKLATCTPASFVGALMALAEIGLEPIAGNAFLIPYRNGRTGQMECQLQIGYKGTKDLFYRHESSLMIDAKEVHEGDEFSIQHGSKAELIHKPFLDHNARGPVIGYYAIGKMKGGGEIFDFMTVEEITAHALKHSKSVVNGKLSGPWVTDFDSMAKKTVMLRIAKMLPTSSVIQRALELDETSREYRKGIKSALDLPSTTDWAKPEQQPIDPPSQDESVEVPFADPEDVPKTTASEKTASDLSILLSNVMSVDSIVADIIDVKERTVGESKKQVTDYGLTVGTEIMSISIFGSPKAGKGDLVKFSKLTAKMYGDRKYWNAQSLERIPQ
jgi:recombination protein RecT